MEDNVKFLKMRKNSFNWSLEPITKCMHVMGVSIPPSSEEVKSCRPMSHISIAPSVFYWYRSFSLFLLFKCFAMLRGIANSYTNGISTTTFSWNFIIDYLNLALYTDGSHISFLLLTRSKTWLDLVLSFKLLEENGHSSEFYPKCRHIAVKVIIYIIITV